MIDFDGYTNNYALKETARVMLGYSDKQMELHEKLNKLLEEYLDELGPVRMTEVAECVYRQADTALDKWLEARLKGVRTEIVEYEDKEEKKSKEKAN